MTMGGLVIEKVRAGVEFVPDAAAAFRRAEATVRSEFGRGIGVNSTYRSWSHQLSMYNAWQRYLNGGPKPNHSRAIHPQYSRHVHGTALDSNDWRNTRIRQILADNGFIRNQLHVKNEEHHFEYIRSSDKNYGQGAGAGTSKPAASKPDFREDDEMIYLYVDDDGAGKKVWVLLNTRTAKILTKYDQAGANGWATVWGNARSVTRQQFLNAIDAIHKTA